MYMLNEVNDFKTWCRHCLCLIPAFQEECGDCGINDADEVPVQVPPVPEGVLWVTFGKEKRGCGRKVFHGAEQQKN